LKFGNSKDCVNRIAVCLWLALNKIPHGYETYDLAISQNTYLSKRDAFALVTNPIKSVQLSREGKIVYYRCYTPSPVAQKNVKDKIIRVLT